MDNILGYSINDFKSAPPQQASGKCGLHLNTSIIVIQSVSFNTEPSSSIIVSILHKIIACVNKVHFLSA